MTTGTVRKRQQSSSGSLQHVLECRSRTGGGWTAHRKDSSSEMDHGGFGKTFPLGRLTIGRSRKEWGLDGIKKQGRGRLLPGDQGCAPFAYGRGDWRRRCCSPFRKAPASKVAGRSTPSPAASARATLVRSSQLARFHEQCPGVFHVKHGAMRAVLATANANYQFF